MGLRAKFNLMILAAFALGFVLAAVVLNGVFVDQARRQVVENARVMMTAANGVRRYTALDLVPLLPQERNGKFVAESVPAFAAQRNFQHLQEAFPGFTYREPSLNSTNLVNRAHDWEADIIHMFRNKPGEAELVTERDTMTGPLLHLARPIVVTQPCLVCHSTPTAAPLSLTRTYGTAN